MSTKHLASFFGRAGAGSRAGYSSRLGLVLGLVVALFGLALGPQAAHAGKCPNLVIILDGHQIQHNNAAAAKKGTALSLENVVMHVLAKGNVYDMHARKFYASKTALAEHGAAAAPVAVAVA